MLVGYVVEFFYVLKGLFQSILFMELEANGVILVVWSCLKTWRIEGQPMQNSTLENLLNNGKQ